MSKKSFFDAEGGRQSPYTKLLQENAGKVRIKRISQAHQALDDLEQDINARVTKLKNVFAFLETKQALYQQLLEQHQHQPSATLASRIKRLKHAIDDLVAKIEETQPKEVIADLHSHLRNLRSELARKMDKK